MITVHWGAGLLALLIVAVPLVAHKGGRIHRRAGWVYAASMAVVAVTGFGVAVYRVASVASAQGAFLAYIAWLTAASLWMGVRVVAVGPRKEAHVGLVDRAVPAGLALAGLGMIGWAFLGGGVLPGVFGALGIVLGTNQLKVWRTAPFSRREVVVAHLGGMLGSAIAAFTAALVVNAGTLFPEVPGLVVWLAPTAVGTPMIVAWSRSVSRPPSGAAGGAARRAGEAPPPPAPRSP